MTLILTRPIREARQLQQELAACHLPSVLSPMLQIEISAEGVQQLKRLAPTHYDGLIATSAHALEGVSPSPAWQQKPLYAVGGRTAAAAEAAGHHCLAWVAETVTELTQCPELTTGSPTLLYLRGAHISHSLSALLPAATIDECIIYRAEATNTFSPEAMQRLADNNCSGVVFFSARSATLFEQQLQTHFPEPPLLRAFCISDRVADIFAGCPHWQCHIAKAPTAASMIELLRQSLDASCL